MVSTPRALQLVEPFDGVSHPLFLVTPGFRIVKGYLGSHDEHVLVHEGHAEISGIDRPRAVLSSGMYPTLDGQCRKSFVR